MSAAPRYPDRLPTDAPYTGLRMTADQYLALGETQERYELIDGVVCMSPSPTPAHQEIKVALASQIMATDLADGRPRVYLDTDVRFSGNLVYCPDLSVYQRSRLPATPKRLTVTPDLIVEVLSPSNRGLDLVTKRHDFDRFGVAEYWVIDPQDSSLRAWRRQGAQLVEAEQAAVAGDWIESSALPGLRIDLRPMREFAGE